MIEGKAIEMKSCGVILAGGKSTRMGQDKAFLPLYNKPVISHIVQEIKTLFDTIIVVANEPAAYSFLQVPVVSDRYQDMGPLAGMETAMFHQEADIYAITACDMPFIDQEIYRYLLGQATDYDAVVPIFENRLHPLAGVYKRSVLPVIQDQLDHGNRKVRSIFDPVRVQYVQTYDSISEETVKKHFFNMNHPEQYEWAKRV